MEKTNVLDFLKRLADGLAVMFGKNCEVVIHDMENFESSIIYITNNHVTEREKGDPFNILGVHEVDSFFEGHDIINHQGKIKNNHLIKSSTFHIKGDDYHYAIGINYDYTDLSHAQSVLTDLTKVGASIDEVINVSNQMEKTLETLYEEALEKTGKPLALMKKEDRVKVIKYLDENDAFSIHKSIPIISQKMNISRYTIYNYLKEIRKENE
ncbi:MAG TPA: helix-turn-helix transcriptional regulator [Bacillota bacterium]|nr:helix-turn-helix transcriptional regulator [Bacillota bacterium]